MFYRTDQDHGLKHNPFKSLVAPRPIAWVSTQSKAGRVNLAPYSFFNGVADRPPIIMFSSTGSHKEGGYKDTLENIGETGEFVVNIVTYELRDAMNVTAGMLDRSVDEMALAGLEPAPSNIVAPPRVAASPAALECRFLQSVELPTSVPGEPNTVTFGLVVGVYINDEILNDGMIDMSRFMPLARLGYQDYTFVEKVFTLVRPG